MSSLSLQKTQISRDFS